MFKDAQEAEFAEEDLVVSLKETEQKTVARRL